MTATGGFQIACAARVALRARAKARALRFALFCPECQASTLHIHVDAIGGESWIGMLW